MKHIFRIGVFDDVNTASRAVDDVLSAGVARQDITIVMPDGQPDELLGEMHREYIIHPGADTTRGLLGGGLGGAFGALIGSFCMFLIGSAASGALLFSLAVSSLAGLASGILAAQWVPAILHKFLYRFAGMPAHERDNRRSMEAGAIGGLFGALAGAAASYLMGIPSIWFFIGTGLYCAAISLVVGGLVGAMSGRGLVPAATGYWEELADSGHGVLVSVDCTSSGERPAQIADLLRRDGARTVKTA